MDSLKVFYLACLLAPGALGAAPDFAAQTDTASLAEDVAVGTTVTVAQSAITGTATSVAILDTSMPDGIESSFTLTMATAGDDFTLVTAATLDRETAASLVLNIRATNGDGTSADASGDLVLTITVTDVNDNSPVFNPDGGCVQMAMNTAAGTAIATVKATDADDTANALHATPYALAEASTVYEVDATSGAVTVSTGQTLDSADKGATLKITAKDKGTNTSTMSLIVCIGDGCCSGSAAIKGALLLLTLCLLVKLF